MTTSPPGQGYHHGNLRSALIEAAEAELVAHGVEKFSLRAVAKRAGVSHAAPAHHFKDVNGLLTALVALSFRRFLAAMEVRSHAAGPDPVERLVGSGMGYIDYAESNPALFDLQFLSDRPVRDDPELTLAARAAFAHLQDGVSAVLAARQPEPQYAEEAIAITWAVAHGLAALFARRRSRLFADLSEDEREAAFYRMLRRVIAHL